MVTRNEILTNEWSEVALSLVSNSSNYPVEFWVGTVEPLATEVGHILRPSLGFKASDFTEGSFFWFKSATNIQVKITVTE